VHNYLIAITILKV